HTVCRYKLASALNFIGLSFAFALFVLIMIQVSTEFSSGTDDPKHKNIYRIEAKSKMANKWHLRMSRFIYEKLSATTPQIKESVRFTLSTSMVKVGDTHYYDIPTIYQGSDISKVIDYDMLEGVASSAMQKGCVLINKSNADRMFGGKSAMDKQIGIGPQMCVVKGVYRDFPSNSMTPNGVVMFNDYGMCSAYFLFAPNTDVEKVADDFNKKYIATEFKDDSDIKFVALADTYFDNQYATGDFLRQGDRSATLILLSIALLIMLIAIINFVNFSTSLAPMRINALNIRSVLGSTRKELRLGIIYEALMFSMISFMVALLWVHIINDTSLVGLFKTSDLTIGTNIKVVVFTGVLAMIIGTLSGVYPAYYCTRFAPALVLKGTFGFVGKGKALRTTLLSVQFVISIALIIGALFIHLQNSYLQNKDLGYNTENVIVVNGVWDRNGKLMGEKIKQLAMINSSASFDGNFGKAGAARNNIIVGSDTIDVHNYRIDENFLSLMNIPVIQGRSFVSSDQEKMMDDNSNKIINVIVNKSALRILNTSVDSLIKNQYQTYRVIGVTDDIIGNSLYNLSGAILFINSDYVNNVVVKVNAAESANAMREIKKVAQQVQSYAYTDVRFFDQVRAALYQKEIDLSLLITGFSLLAIVLSLMGVFGLVVFETSYRRKEIGLRKINGATIESVLVMFNRRFVWLVVICFLIAVPFAWYGVDQWLKGFAYHTPIYLWVFVLAFFIVLLITVITVTVQSWRTAIENPIESIKTE
ncbi:MAG: FtsX-like permease family protein, partial [Rikenellaceae bacterium]